MNVYPKFESRLDEIDGEFFDGRITDEKREGLREEVKRNFAQALREMYAPAHPEALTNTVFTMAFEIGVSVGGFLDSEAFYRDFFEEYDENLGMK